MIISINVKIFRSFKGMYIISTESLANKNLYKVGYSGCQLKNRLSQINEILSPSLQEHLRIDKIFKMPDSTYRLHFVVQDWEE